MDHRWLDAVRHHKAVVWDTQHERRLFLYHRGLHTDCSFQLIVQLFHVQQLKVVERHESLDFLESRKLNRIAKFVGLSL